MATTTTTNMSMVLPVPSSEPGPAYATEINNALTTLDSHNHTVGNGVKVPVAGMNINTDLPMATQNLTQARSVRFTANGTPLTTASTSDVGCVYVAGADLYYNDTAGNQVRMTTGGGVAGTPGSITSLTSPATATYSAAQTKFVWQSGVNLAADTDCRNVILRNATASSKGCTVNPPAAMGSDITQTLPTLPGAKSFMTIDASGNMEAQAAYSAGITNAMLATSNYVLSSVGYMIVRVDPGEVTISTCTAVITTVGRPVAISFIGNTGSSAISHSMPNTTTDTYGFTIDVYRDGAIACRNAISTWQNTGVQLTYHSISPGSLNGYDFPAAGSHTYTIKASVTGTASFLQITKIQMMVREL